MRVKRVVRIGLCDTEIYMKHNVCIFMRVNYSRVIYIYLKNVMITDNIMIDVIPSACDNCRLSLSARSALLTCRIKTIYNHCKNDSH